MEKLKLIKNIFKYFFGLIIYYASYIIRRDSSVWVFGAWKGLNYTDNSKYLFEYLNKNHKHIKAIWMVRDKLLKAKIEENGYKAYIIFSIKGLYWSLKAKYGVVTNGLIDINRFAVKNMKIINLWHGIPLKPILFADKKKKAVNDYKQKRKLAVIFPFLKKELNYNDSIIPSSSSFVSSILNGVFKKDEFPILGFPRNDGFFRQADSSLKRELNNIKVEGFDLGIYMPTYRQKHEFDIIKYFLDHILELNDFLQEENIILYVKLHPFVKEIEIPPYCSNISLVPRDNKDDIYNLLNSFDFLITDYSSILFDYSIIKRPIILSSFDYNSYIKSNGEFILDYYKELPYPKTNSWTEVIKVIENVKNQEYRINNKQSKYSDKIHFYKDGDSSERVYNYIINNS